MIRSIRIVLAVTVSGTLTLSACGDSQIGNSTAIDAPNTETSLTSVAASTTERAESASTTPPHGVLVSSREDDANANEWVEYGTFDLATGEYTKFKTFYAPEGVFLQFGEPWETDRHSFSPDWTKTVATMHVGSDTHAGWVDERGMFTDITQAATRAPVGDFTSSIGHIAFAFDKSNHFYFVDIDGKLMQVSLDNPSVAVETGSAFDGGGFPPDRVWMPNGNLWTPGSGPEPVGYADMCININSVAWIDEYTFVEEDGETQLGVGDVRKDPCPHVSSSGYERELLPEGTGYEIGDDVVLNPARDTVAFRGSAGAPRFSGVFTVPISGGAPTKTAVTEEMLEGYRMIGWN